MTDQEVMGTPEAAYAALVAKAREWRAVRQPLAAGPKRQREFVARQNQVRFELANAALLWLWHVENPPKPLQNAEVFSRPECTFKYCPHRDQCLTACVYRGG